jgi:16S rRNA (guanine527-N7)-methyltransferase
LERRREPLPTRVQDTPPLPEAYHDALDRGVAALGLDLTPDARAAIDGHARLLLAWTTAINLTAIREPGAVARGHVVDSLTGYATIASRRPRRVLDLGSGGGYPGIPLAAMLGEVAPPPEMTLLEPTGKKARFLSTVTEATGIGNRVRVDARRAEEVARDRSAGSWDVVTGRAVASAADLVELAFPVLAPGGSLVAWKRGHLSPELAAARRAIDALGGGEIEVIDIHVDGLDGHRLVVATRAMSGSVPDRFPRDPAHRTRSPW